MDNSNGDDGSPTETATLLNDGGKLRGLETITRVLFKEGGALAQEHGNWDSEIKINTVMTWLIICVTVVLIFVSIIGLIFLQKRWKIFNNDKPINNR